MINPLELDTLLVKFHQVSKKRASHESLPYATAGKLAKLDSIPL